jgi:hypothetical protein
MGHPLLPRRSDGYIPFGFNDYAVWDNPPRATYSEDMALHRRVGSSIIRIGLEWGYLERFKDVYNWGSPDLLYCAATNAGLRPLFVLWTSPVWAVADSSLCTVAPCRRPPSASNLPELRQFAEAAAIRYPAALFEIWNEPNLRLFWGSNPDPPRYAEVLAAGYTGVKNGNPDAPVLGGALSNNQVDAPANLSVLTFLRGMYSAGAGASMDAVSFHPSPVIPDFTREVSTRTFEQVQRVVGEFGEAGRRRLIPSEVGASTTHTDPVQRFTEDQQLNWMIRSYQTAAFYDNVDAIVFHTLIEPYSALDQGYGWVRRKSTAGVFWPKPAYCGFAAAFGTPTDCSKPVPLG